MGKTRETTQQTDPYLTEVARQNVTRAQLAEQIPFMANRGGTIAGFTDPTLTGWNMNNSAAAAAGFGTNQYIPPAGETIGGIFAHSGAGHYDDMVRRSITPGRRDFIDSFFVGADGLPTAPAPTTPSSPQAQNSNMLPYYNVREGGEPSFSPDNPADYGSFGEFTGAVGKDVAALGDVGKSIGKGMASDFSSEFGGQGGGNGGTK